jgi:integrase
MPKVGADDYGSYLLSEQVSITTVSKILGHANPAITMGIYAHE